MLVCPLIGDVMLDPFVELPFVTIKLSMKCCVETEYSLS